MQQEAGNEGLELRKEEGCRGMEVEALRVDPNY